MEKVFILIALVAILLAVIFIIKYHEEKRARVYAEEELIKLTNRIVNIEDKAPKGNRPVDNVLCLQDKLKHYVKRDGNKVKLTILK